MAVFAVIKDSIVVNTIIADSDYTSQDGLTLVEVPFNLPVSIGHLYIESYFFDNEGNMIQPYVEEFEVTEVIE